MSTGANKPTGYHFDFQIWRFPAGTATLPALCNLVFIPFQYSFVIDQSKLKLHILLRTIQLSDELGSSSLLGYLLLYPFLSLLNFLLAGVSILIYSCLSVTPFIDGR